MRSEFSRLGEGQRKHGAVTEFFSPGSTPSWPKERLEIFPVGFRLFVEGMDEDQGCNCAVEGGLING
jgi:hypothetical protein